MPTWKADELVQAVPGMERALLPNTGHFAPEEAPADFASAVADFIDRRRHEIALAQESR